jgi:BirA family biotin operon repressor/biotin-[acetyl-CoA-carboxylase] ligase
MADWPQGVGREVHATLDSTNAEALRRAAREPGPLWILARAQTAARGRRGRPWVTGAGNFAATLLMTPPGGVATAALRSFVAALALRDALADATGARGALALKWPNDVLLDGRKVAGILLETAEAGGRLAIGFGVNLGDAPEPARLEAAALAPTSVLAATGVVVGPEALLDRLAPAFAAWEARLVTEGFGPLRAAWLAGAARLGEPLVARLPDRSVSGRFETIDGTGALVLATQAGRVVLAAAEVHFPEAAQQPPQEVPPAAPPEVPPVPEGVPELPPVEVPPSAPEAPPEMPPEFPPAVPSGSDHAARH